MKFHLWLLLVFDLSFASCEVYTSIGQLTTLVESITNVTRIIEDFMYREFEVLQQAKKTASEFRKLSDIAEKDAETFIGNPVNSFLLIKALAKDLHYLLKKISNTDRLNEITHEIYGKHLIPMNDDYEGAISAIHRLEDTYALEPSDLRVGKMSQKYAQAHELNAFECFELGRIAYERSDWYHTVRWMSESLEMLDKEGANATISRFIVLDYLAFSTARQGNFKHAYDLTKEMLEIDPNHERAKNNLNHYDEALRDEKVRIENEKYGVRNPRQLTEFKDKYEKLCRGDGPQIAPKTLKNLKCRYINYHPLLKIAPVKEEQLYDNPAIWLFHDVITDKQIEVMKSLARPRLKRALVQGDNGSSIAVDYRVSKSAWLLDEEHRQLGYLTKQLSAVTNLSMSTAEEWQIANYGIGGQYEPHLDFFNNYTEAWGNRIATWLFYLDAPEKGGATVFPEIGVAVGAKKGAAAFWYNLHASGDGNFMTRHAACPVLFGAKWVSNRWIHERDQEFRRPCLLQYDTSEDK